MASRVRTIDFLPEIFQTPSNEQFLAATLDQLIQPPSFQKIQGYIGSKFGYGVNAKDGYVVEPDKTRKDYQLEPAVIFKKKDTQTAIDAITYPELMDSIKLNGGFSENHQRLFSNEFYSWSGFVDLDKLINYSQYYWVPEGPESININTDDIYRTGDFTVTNNNIDYTFATPLINFETANPTITLVRGGTYNFVINQKSKFYIQTEPGISGFQIARNNISTREIYGLSFNGTSSGVMPFNVPLSDSQDDNNYPGDNKVDLVTTLKFTDVHGKRLSEIKKIDSVSSLQGKTLLFYGTQPKVRAYINDFYNEYGFDIDEPNQVIPNKVLVSSIAGSITDFDEQNFDQDPLQYTTNTITCDSTVGFKVNDVVRFAGVPFGNIDTNLVYYIESIKSSTEFSIKQTLDGWAVELTNGSTNSNGNLYAIVNEGGFEESTTTIINNNFYTIEYVGDNLDPTIQLREVGSIPDNEKITVVYGEQYVTQRFVRNSYGEIRLVPTITANLDTLYYQDGDNPTMFGKIKLIDSPNTAFIRIDEILGSTGYTSPNGITFTNGMKVRFNGNIIPESYKNDQYYVEGVGTSISLLPVTEQLVPELFTQAFIVPFDNKSYDVNPYGDALLVPTEPDYITINRNCISKNAWARSNRWFHIDVLNYTLTKNQNSPIVKAALSNPNYRAKRPIIEFVKDIKLVDAGAVGKTPVDFINFTATDALRQVAGQPLISFKPDGSTSELFNGARIIFANDTNVDVRNKIYVANISKVTNTDSVITLTKAVDGDVKFNEQAVILKGVQYIGNTYYFDGNVWKQSQSKQYINQYPKFDVFDSNGISFSDRNYYVGSDFEGCTLFEYQAGSGTIDPILKFPIKYSSITNIGDIGFNISLNTQKFDYVYNSQSMSMNVNTGYVHTYSSNSEYTRKIGWEKAIDNSFQYQVFNLVYTGTNFVCDVKVKEETSTKWPVITVYVDNQRTTNYTYSTTNNSTTVALTTTVDIGTPIEILIYSDQISASAYYQMPSNFDHNPFNSELSEVNLGDLRGHYKSICNNTKSLKGSAFGANNFRDLGNLIPYGTRIVQHSAPMIPSALFLKSNKNNIFSAMEFNSREYIRFKTILLDYINNGNYTPWQSAADMLDDAMQDIVGTKTEESSFFWSDMLPTKGAYITKTYSFKSGIDSANFTLDKVYDYTKANYNGVLVYLTRIVNGLPVTTQLIKDIDYEVSATSKNLYVSKDLIANDIITVKEYNQTYGSYVPNTPTKLGLYPKFLPEVVLDDSYLEPTYFIKGHDGSYTKLYGDYNNGILEDFRDKVLLEFERRIYNNLKVDAKIPLEYDDIYPGQFRKTDYSFQEIKEIHSLNFLNWIGLNRIDFINQYYDSTNEFTWNYSKSINKLDGTTLHQGHWRGVYMWLYDTASPHSKPWEMLGLFSKPSWWDDRYGAAPYTSNNLLLWDDISKGFVYNNGDSYINNKRIRPDLLKVLPVDSRGKLISPFTSIVNSYDVNTFENKWNVGDMAPAEYAYIKSSSYPFDLMKTFALTKPAIFFSLGLDLDLYKYNDEFNQYLVLNRYRQSFTNLNIYGLDNTTASHSYLNWIVDYLNQYGLTGSIDLASYINNVDIRLTYRMAGFSDQEKLKFFAEKGSPNSKNNSLLIPDDSYNIILYQNTPYKTLDYSSIIIQKTKFGFKVYGNSQDRLYFTINEPMMNGTYDTVTINSSSILVAKNYTNNTIRVPYGTEFVTLKELAQFVKSYGTYLEQQGMIFDNIENAIELNWNQMIAELIYWVSAGWEEGSTVNLNPNANRLNITSKFGTVEPLTNYQTNYILNQNLLPIATPDLRITRLDNAFTAVALNAGDSISYFKGNVSSVEHLVIFDNTTVFNDVMFNLVTGLRQQRIYVKGAKTSDWTGTMNAYGFIINQDNVEEWTPNIKYNKGSIVKYKNNYWIANVPVVIPSNKFNPDNWKQTSYNLIQKGLLPNPSTKSQEALLYYDTNAANLKNDADLLSFSLIGYRPRPYLAEANLDDTTQVNIYKNIIYNKGSKNAFNVLTGINLQQSGLSYESYENWAIKTSEYGGKLNKNFIEFTLKESELVGNPSTVALVHGNDIEGIQQQTQLYDLTNYGFAIDNLEVLPTIPSTTDSKLPSAGYVNLNDVRYTGYHIDSLNKNTISDVYKNDYIWIADKVGEWKVYTPISSTAKLVNVVNNLNNTITLIFDTPHNLVKDDFFGIIEYDYRVNGYYTVTSVPDIKLLVVSATLDASTTAISSNNNSIMFKFINQRVETGKDLVNLPLLNAEYVKNKIWVDKDSNGEWNVLRKTLNYEFNLITKPDRTTEFGGAVAYSDKIGCLVSDSAVGKVYSYRQMSDTSNKWFLTDTITHSPGFGAAIAKNNDILIISQPDPFGDLSLLYVYRIVNTNKLTTLVEEQILALAGFRLGDALALSGDSELLYASLIDLNAVVEFQKNADYATFNIGTLKREVTAGATAVAIYGSVTVPEGILLAFSPDSYVETYMVITTEYDQSSNTTTIYIDKPVAYNVASGMSVYRKSVQYSILGAITSEGLANGTDMFSYSLATNQNGSKLFVGSPQSDFSVGARDTGYVFAFDRLIENWEVVGDSLPGGFALFFLPWTPTPTSMVYINGVRVRPNYYVLILNLLIMGPILKSGDVVTVSSGNLVLIQEVASYDQIQDIDPGAKFGWSLDCNTSGSELLVGSPHDIDTDQVEGAVYRYSNEGKHFGRITGILQCNLLEPVSILINGYRVALPEPNLSVPGDAFYVANKINQATITNVFAYATEDNRLVIRLRDIDLNPANNKLNLTVFNGNVLTELGIAVYLKTQVVRDPHSGSRTQFGHKVKFNEQNSFVVSAPAATRYLPTMFDFSDDENQHNDTVFDNNFTRFEDSFVNAGTVYMYDYIPSYNESLLRASNYVYSQALPDLELNYGKQPLYGTSLDFCNNKVVIGSPYYKTGTTNGRVVMYENTAATTNWTVYRKSTKVVDIEKIQKVHLYNNLTDVTLTALDYFDPLQGKLLGPIRENLDYILSTDPAGYNNLTATKGNLVWGPNQIGKIWFDVSNTKFINYHQDDLSYNTKYWGTVFPGSTITVYSWIESDVLPALYTGTGTPYDFSKYSLGYETDASGNLVTKYYYWVRDTNTLFSLQGKTLTDVVIAQYISNPQNSGVSYFASLSPNIFALYNAREFINGNNTDLHIGYSLNDMDTSSHLEFQLIRDGNKNDFLTGLPDRLTYKEPAGLYNKLLCSFAGVDEIGQVLPNPTLPKKLQTGVGVRPNQTLFVNRFNALKNYLEYANQVIKNYPITEFSEITFLNDHGDTYDTRKYWSHIYWWAEGFGNNTRTAFEVPKYYDLLTLTVTENLIVGVSQNSQNKREVYQYVSGQWNRIGLEDGTITFSNELWDYNNNSIGFGDVFFDTVDFDSYPAVETRNIIRAINEQIFVGPLNEHKNKSLILIFKYIQSENVSSNNYLPWLNKTSLADVSYNIRDLLPYQKYQTDNINLLEQYLNEVKPYHVVLKEFSFKYNGIDLFSGNISDFDLPSTYDFGLKKFVTPQLSFNDVLDNEQYGPSDSHWKTNPEYQSWLDNYGLSLISKPNQVAARLMQYITTVSNEIRVDNAKGLPTVGLIKIDDELISYSNVNREQNILYNINRGVNNTIAVDHYPETNIFMDLPSIVVQNTARGYIDPPIVKAVIDTNKYPAPKREAVLRAVMSGDKVIEVNVLDPGEGYLVNPDIVFQSAFEAIVNYDQINFSSNLLVVDTPDLRTGDLLKIESNNTDISEAIVPGYYYVRVLGFNTRTISANYKPVVSLHYAYASSIKNEHKVVFKQNAKNEKLSYTLKMVPKTVVVTDNKKTREFKTTVKFDRTSYTSSVEKWQAGKFWQSPFSPSGSATSTTATLSTAIPFKFEFDIFLGDGLGTQNSSTGTGVNFTVYNLVLGRFYWFYITDPANAGSGYRVGDTITIYGNNLGGISPENDCVVTVTSIKGTGSTGPINTVTTAGIPKSLVRTNDQGALLPITGVEADTDGSAVVKLNYGPSTLKPSQIKGLQVYFYRTHDSYTYDDSGKNFMASINDTTLNVVLVTNGSLAPNDFVYGGRAVLDNTIIVSQLTARNTAATTKIVTATTGDTTITVPNNTGIVIGQVVMSDGTDAGTFVTGISGTTVTLNIPLISDLADEMVSFCNPGKEGTYLINNSHDNFVSIRNMSTGGGGKFEIFRPKFNTTNITNQYYMRILNYGHKYYDDYPPIIISGTNFGGTSPVNDCIITIQYANSNGEIQLASVDGKSPSSFDIYYVIPTGSVQVKLYKDATLLRPIAYADFAYSGTGIYANKDFAFIAEPFTIGQYRYNVSATVSYNNKIWRCINSNSDLVFDYTKWVEINSDDPSLNALDRVVGFYNPSINMPGNDIKQLFDGVTNPNPVYYGNKFAPEDVLPIEFILKDQQFYPREVEIKAIVFSGSKYLAVGNTNTTSVVMTSIDGANWTTKNISDRNINVTDIIYSGTFFVITTNNVTSPLLVSSDGDSWTTISASNTNFDMPPYGMFFDLLGLSSPNEKLNSLVYTNGKYFSIGPRILKSTNAIVWDTVFDFNGTRLNNEIKSIIHVNAKNFTGYIAVGGGQVLNGGGDTAFPDISFSSKIVLGVELNGTESWSLQTPALTTEGLNTVIANTELIVVAGDNGKVFNSVNGRNWITCVLTDSLSYALRDSAFGNNTFVLVGDHGTILVSDDGYSFTVINSPIINNLYGVSFDGQVFYAVGAGGTIIRSVDGTTWEDLTYVNTKLPLYDIKGSDFLYGYGPDEMVPGIINDNLQLTITDRPGSWWDSETYTQNKLYGYTGFTMKSIVSAVDNTLSISFNNVVENPAQLSVYLVGTGLTGRRIYETSTSSNPIKYTVNWINKTITLNQNPGNNLQVLIEVYEVGNGFQLARSNSQYMPMTIDSVTGNSQILLNIKSEDLETPVVYRNGTKLVYLTDYIIDSYGVNLMKILFNTVYDTAVDYISFAILRDSKNDFNSTSFGYSIPETQTFVYNGTSSIFTLSNYIGKDNIANAIVEVNGLRLSSNQYSISLANKQITITKSLSNNDIVAVTTFNETVRQYLHTDSSTAIKVFPINNVDNVSQGVSVTVAYSTGFVNGDRVQMNGIIGSDYLNDRTLYIRIARSYTSSGKTYQDLALYTDSGLTSPVKSSSVNKYVSGGYITKYDNLMTISYTTITLESNSASYDVIPTSSSRFWVTINGNRLKSSESKMVGNKLFILSYVQSGDNVIVTSMVTGASPNQTSFMVNIDRKGAGAAYNISYNNTTYLTQSLYETEDTIYFNDVSKIVRVGTNIIVVDNEKIGFTSVDYTTNTVSGLTRGIEGTGVKKVHDIYSVTHGLGLDKRLPDQYYNLLWNSRSINNYRGRGDPMQLSNTVAAKFLETGQL